MDLSVGRSNVLVELISAATLGVILYLATVWLSATMPSAVGEASVSVGAQWDKVLWAPTAEGSPASGMTLNVAFGGLGIIATLTVALVVFDASTAKSNRDPWSRAALRKAGARAVKNGFVLAVWVVCCYWVGASVIRLFVVESVGRGRAALAG